MECPFFNDRMSGKPVIADMYKKKYCKGESDACARYVVFKKLGKAHVPRDLYPNQLERVDELIA